VRQATWSSSLDWVICKQIQIQDLWKEEAAASDHHIVGWTIEVGRKEAESREVFQTRNFKKLVENQGEFVNSLMRQPWEKLAEHDLETQAGLFNKWILHSLDEVAPLQEMRYRRSKMAKPSAVLRNIRRKRDDARSRGHTKLFKKLRNQAVLLGRKEQRDNNNDQIAKNSQNVWTILRSLQGKEKHRHAQLEHEGRTLDASEATRLLNTFFVSKIARLKEEISKKAKGDPDASAAARAKKLGLCQNLIHFQEVTVEETMNAIKKSKPSKTRTDCHPSFSSLLPLPWQYP